MRLHDNGNVGIGTTNPQAKLDVNGTFRSVGIAYLNSDVQVGGDQIIFTNDAASAYIQGADVYTSNLITIMMIVITNQ